MNVTVQLKCSAEPQRSAAAWWLAGDSVDQWLMEVASWPTVHHELRLHAIPGDSNGTISGVLVIVPQKDSLAVESFGPAGIAYSSVGDRLFIPVDARFNPPASDEEVAALLPNDSAIYVWQPARGLVRCDESGKRELGQLLALPSRNAHGWDRAVSGVALNDRLISVEPWVTPEIEQFLKESAGDIGTMITSLRELPYSPNEVRFWRAFRWVVVGIAIAMLIAVILFIVFRGVDGLNWPLLLMILALVIAAIFLLPRLARWAKEAAARYQKSGPARTVGATGGALGSVASWFANAKRWVADRASAFNEQLEAMRHRELDRLMHMLDARPDEGLRYAMPLTGQGLHRGMAFPGARLIERLVDFSLGGLGGGGPADIWNIGHDYQARLVAKYRELANREIALGRHRRAAYIFAQLLGDLRAAAATLADGGHYREAAALYDQRLKDSHSAAQCLERGGLLSEAIVFYHGFGNHEKVGELYDKLGQEDFAEQAYRRALQVKLDSRDYLGAARLSEKKLRQPDEALRWLLQGWPDSPQASLCLDESFKLLGRGGAHEQAEQQLIRLAQEYGSSAHATQLATCFARQATIYPDAELQRLAADQTRVLAARKLNDASHVDRRKLLQAVQQLVPQDLLLARDCARFDSSPSATKPKPRLAQVENEFKLPAGVWKTAIATGNEFYAAGWRDSRESDVLLIRGLWDGTLQEPAGKPWREDSDNYQPILMGCSGREGVKILIHINGANAIPDRVFPQSDWFTERKIGGHPAFDDGTFAMHVFPGGVVDTIRIGSYSFVVSSHSLNSSQLIHTVRIPLIESEGKLQSPFLVTRFGRQVIVCAGDSLFIPDKGQESAIRLPSRIWSVFSTMTVKGELFFAMLEAGGFVSFGNPFECAGIHFAEELTNPVGCVLGNDLVLVADSMRIQTYKIESSQLRLIATRHGQFGDPIAVLPLPNHDRAALFLRDGRVLIHKFR